MHDINQIESRLGHFTVMMAVRFPGQSCPTWEPFNLISKDKKEGQMLSSFYAHQLSIIMQSMWAWFVHFRIIGQPSFLGLKLF